MFRRGNAISAAIRDVRHEFTAINAVEHLKLATSERAFIGLHRGLDSSDTLHRRSDKANRAGDNPLRGLLVLLGIHQAVDESIAPRLIQGIRPPLPRVGLQGLECSVKFGIVHDHAGEAGQGFGLACLRPRERVVHRGDLGGGRLRALGRWCRGRLVRDGVERVAAASRSRANQSAARVGVECVEGIIHYFFVFSPAPWFCSTRIRDAEPGPYLRSKSGARAGLERRRSIAACGGLRIP